jgi:ABC-type amino acid transport substrate-binding protein
LKKLTYDSRTLEFAKNNLRLGVEGENHLLPLSVYALKRRGVLFSLGSLFSLSSASAHVQNKVSLTLGTDSDSTKFSGIYLTSIYSEAFRRLGWELKLVVAPLKRLLHLLESGQIDGEMARSPAYALQHPELIEVDAKIMEIDFSIYSLRPLANIKTIDDLKNSQYRGVYRLGVIFCEENLKLQIPAERLTTSNHTKQSLLMVAAGRADFFCDTSSSVWNEEYHPSMAKGTVIYKVVSLSNELPLKAYLHKKNASLAPLLAQTLRKMEKDGTLENLRKAAILKASK